MPYTNFPTQFANPFTPQFTGCAPFTPSFATPWNSAWCATPSFNAWNGQCAPNCCTPSFQNSTTPWMNTPWFGAPSFQATPFASFGAWTPSFCAPQFAAPCFTPEFAPQNAWFAPMNTSFAGYNGFAPVTQNPWNQTPGFATPFNTPGFAPVNTPWNFNSGYTNGVYGSQTNGYAGKSGLCREAA